MKNHSTTFWAALLPEAWAVARASSYFPLRAALTVRVAASPERGAWVLDQALTASEALGAYTLGAAYAGGQESHQGSLAPGKFADMVVLAEDPFTIPPDHLASMQVAATLVGGEMVYGTLE